MNEPYDTDEVNRSIDSFIADIFALRDELKVLTMDRDVWKSRAESKMAVWRETLEKCVGALEETKLYEPDSGPDAEVAAALAAARELLEVTP